MELQKTKKRKKVKNIMVADCLKRCILYHVGLDRDNDCWEKELPSITLREKCPNTEFFLVRILPYPVQMRESTDQKKLRIWTLFTQCQLLNIEAELDSNTELKYRITLWNIK